MNAASAWGYTQMLRLVQKTWDRSAKQHTFQEDCVLLTVKGTLCSQYIFHSLFAWKEKILSFESCNYGTKVPFIKTQWEKESTRCDILSGNEAYSSPTILENLRHWLKRVRLHWTRLAETPVFGSRGGSKSSLFGAEDVGIGTRGTNHVLHRNSLMGWQSATLAICVSRLPVCKSCKLSLLSMVPPM